MPRIRVDIDELAVAASDHDSEWVLDLETGKTLMTEWIRDPGLHGDLGLDLDEAGEGEDPDDELGALDPLDSGRFVGIEPVASHEGFRWMEDFASAQQDRVRERLLDALDRPRPFRRFKDALHEFPQVRDAWYRYEEEKLRAHVREWVTYRGLDVELFQHEPSPAPTSSP